MDVDESVLFQTECENLMDLNDDCLLYLLRFFDLRDLIELRGVCHRLDNLILQRCAKFSKIDFNSLPVVWKRIYMLDIFRFVGPVIKSLTLNEKLDDISKLAVLDSIRDHCLVLKSLTIKFEFDHIRTIRKFTEIVKRLNFLKLWDSEFDDSLSECFKDAALVELEIDENPYITEHFFKHVKNLTSLSISDCSKLTVESYIKILAQNLKLKQFSITNYNYLNDKKGCLTEFIANNLIELRELSFNVHFHNVNLFGDLPHLKMLEIDRSGIYDHNFDNNLISQDVNKLLKKFSQKNNIEELSLCYYEEQQLEINMDDLSKLTNLKKLYLSGIQELKNDVIKKLGTLKNLESLDIESPVGDSAFLSLISLVDQFKKLKDLGMFFCKVNLEFLEKLIETLRVSKDRPKLKFYIGAVLVGKKSNEFHELRKNNLNVIDVHYNELDTENYFELTN